MSGTSEEDHLKTLKIVLQRLLSAGLLVKKENYQFRVSSTSYLGHKIDSERLHPLPDKIDAIQRATTPQSMTELKAFLRLMNYYGKFIQNLATILHPHYELFSSSVKWEWTKEREDAFNQAKYLLMSDRVLIHFDPKKRPDIVT